MREPDRDTSPDPSPRGSVEIQPDIYRGQRIGKYEVVALLTTGGMAELFLAFTAGPGGFRKYVVLKRILADVRSEEEFVKMFLDEARITAAFAHPNIGQVFDLGEEEDGLYLAMEFIAGQNLNQISRESQQRKVTLSAGFACMVARDVCLALQYAHTFADPTGKPFAVIHRDVAQKNVMVTYEGVTKLLDFGIAKARGKLGRTHTGMVKGTTGYMSPEQVHGEQLDGRSDVFSVGVMLHELLTGHRLFSAATEMEEMQKILSAPIPSPKSLVPDLPQAISDAVMRSLARSRSDRFASARDMAKALEQAAGPLLLEREQASAFMKELFSNRLKATQALLEAAGGGRWDQKEMSAALKVLTEDVGAAFPDAVAAAPRVRAEAASAPRKPAHDTDEDPRISSAKATPSTDSKWARYGPILVLVVALGLTGWAVYRTWLTPSPPLPLLATPPLGPVPMGSLKPYPEGQAGGRAPAVAPEPQATTKEPSARPDAGTHAPAVKMGKLTLITLPDSKVLSGSKVVGRTPLFNLPFPIGTHLLRLQGADGRIHLLSVQIHPDKPARFRFALADLPTER